MAGLFESGYPRVDSVQKVIKKLKTAQQLDEFLKKMSLMSWKAGFTFIGAIGFCHSSCKVSIIFYIYPLNKSKIKKIGITHPREIFSTGLMNLSPHLEKNNSSSLEFGLEWTNTHKLDFIGLAQLASPEETKKIKIENLKIESLKHSRKKEISKKELKKGKVELKPVQFLELTFPYKKITLKPQEIISFFLKSKGYYKKV